MNILKLFYFPLDYVHTISNIVQIKINLLFRSILKLIKFTLKITGSPEPPPPPPRNHDPNVSNTSNEANDSKDSNQISEAECDQHQQSANQSLGGK